MMPNAAHQRRADTLNVEHIYAKCALAACACYTSFVSTGTRRFSLGNELPAAHEPKNK
jgi:hypothetical protein